MSESQNPEALCWRCACCGASESHSLEYRDQFFGDALQECTHCGHIQLARTPSSEDLRSFYSDAYSKKRRLHAGPAYMRVMARRASAQIDFIERRITLRNRRLIDAGCGFGSLLLAARKHGADALGFEFDPHVADACQAKSLDVRLVASESDLADQIREEKPDIVALSHLLEHLRDPIALLRACRGAAVFIEVPRYRADVAEQFRDQEGHLHFFTTQSIGKILGQLVLPTFELESCGPSIDEFWRDSRSWERKLRRFLTRDPFSHQYTTSHEDGIWIRALAHIKENIAAS